jgi:hypothetical protein
MSSFFDSLTAYVVFLRYKRSGSALLVNLLDAHPNIVFVRNEEMYAKFNKWGSAQRIFDHLYSNTKRYRSKPFSANGFSYPIEGVGRCVEPKVIGHKSSTRNMFPLADNSFVLRDFQRMIGLPLKHVHLIRNPYHMVAARWQQKEFRRKNAPLGPIIDHLEEVTRLNSTLASRAEKYYQIHLEDIIFTPEDSITRLCQFLGVEAYKDYLARCSGLVSNKIDIEGAPWTKGDRERILGLISQYRGFYGRYDREHRLS